MERCPYSDCCYLYKKKYEKALTMVHFGLKLDRDRVTEGLQWLNLKDCFIPLHPLFLYFLIFTLADMVDEPVTTAQYNAIHYFR